MKGWPCHDTFPLTFVGREAEILQKSYAVGLQKLAGANEVVIEVCRGWGVLVERLVLAGRVEKAGRVTDGNRSAPLRRGEEGSKESKLGVSLL